MTTISKFYLHDAASGDTGTLPTTVQTATTVVGTVAGATTARFMDGTIGASQVQVDQAAPSVGLWWFRQFISDPIAAQTFTGAGTITLTFSGACKSTISSRGYAYRAWVGVWRPSTGALVGTLLDSGGTSLFTSVGTAEFAGSNAFLNGAGFTCADGDVLVVQLYDNNALASGQTHTLYYDGTTEASTTSNASFVNFSVPVTMFTPPADPNPGISESRGGTV